ncbi:LysR family transcriptional regulator [Alteraurantiacibacter buctensis]|nr:LysR family transcriptional regulator [Alteraurantiacibacter buctensis]
MAFTLRQIEVFVEAAQDENFRKTADRLNISQPAISRHIRLLEQHAGGRLFVRDRGSHAQLSPLGEAMLVEARAVLRAAQKVSFAAETDGMEVTVRIAAGNYLLDRWIRPNVRRLFATEDGLNLEFVQAAQHEELLRLVRAGEADCAFYTGDLLDLPGLEFTALRETSVGIYAAPALAARVRQVPADLAGLPYVLSNRGTPSEAWQLATLRGAGVAPARIAARSQFMEVIIDHVVEGQGASLIFDEDARPYVEKGQMVRLPVDIPTGQRVLVTRRDRQPHPRKELVIRRIGRMLQEGLA